MSNNTVLLSRPIKDGCQFNAVGNPVVYKLRREDYQFAAINNDGGFAQLEISGIDLTAYFQVGNTLYVEELGLVTVTASAFSGGDTLVTTDFTFVATGTGYVNNLSKRTDYKIEVEVFNISNVSLGPRIVQIFDQTGETKVDISGIVRAFLAANWTEPTINDLETETSLGVYIKYQEFYDVTYFELVTDAATPIVCVFAIMHLLQNSPPDFSRYLHGGNMLSYCPEDDTKKWLTRFPSPSMWRGYPFSLSFLWADFTDINRHTIQKNSEGTTIADTTTVLSGSDGNVYRMKPITDLEAAATELTVILEDGSASSPDQITDELIIQVKDPCPNQVLLLWKNSKGGDSFWMFDESQEYQYAYPSGRKVTRMVLFSDNLQIDEWDAINELNSPSDVIAQNIVDYAMDDSVDKTHFRNDNQVFIINQDATKVGVIVIQSDNRTKTIQRKHSIEIQIELPELFTV